MIKCLKIFFILVGLITAYSYFDYWDATQDQHLIHTKWKLSGSSDHSLMGCTDIYVLTQMEMPLRDQAWSVEYDYGDVVLKVNRNNAIGWCRYSSKGDYPEH